MKTAYQPSESKAPNLTSYERKLLVLFIQGDKEYRIAAIDQAYNDNNMSGSLLHCFKYLLHV